MFCSPVVTIINHVYEKVCSFVVSLVLLCNGILCHRVSGSMFCCVNIVVFYVSIFFPWYEVVGVELNLN